MKKGTGKTLTLSSKIIAVLFAMFMFKFSTRSAAEILAIAGFIAEAFITVDISLIKTAVKREK